MIVKQKTGSRGIQFTEFREGSVSVSLYSARNRIQRLNPKTGQKEVISDTPQFAVVFWNGGKRIVRKFANEVKARAEAEKAVIDLANGDSEALKLTGLDRSRYVTALRKLRELQPQAAQPADAAHHAEPDLGLAVGDYVGALKQLRVWNPDADRGPAVSDYLAAAKRLPAGTSLKEAVEFFCRRHPSGLPKKTVREVIDELLAAKENAGRSEVYVKDLRLRLNRFADAFQVPIATVTGHQIEQFLLGLKTSGRTQRNFLRNVSTLFKFGIRRGYLPKDFDEHRAVEKPDEEPTEIEVFTPDELRRLFAAARPEMIPYLAIAAFSGLRSAEIQRLDWSEIHLAGPEKYIEVKAGKAKTASRRLAPVPDNLAEWLARYVQPAGPVSPFERMDKQCFFVLGPAAGIQWKHNGLRHGFISYRLAEVKDVGQVALEAGNSPQMIFKHYRKLVTATQAADWFSIRPAREPGQIIPMPATPTPTADNAAASGQDTPDAGARSAMPAPALPAAK